MSRLKTLLLWACLLSLVPLYAEVQFVQVRSSGAIVYADIDLISPIGHFPAGSTIKVGKVFRKYGQVLPTAVSGRLAFVRVEDLILPLEMASLAEKTKNQAAKTSTRESIEVIETVHQIEDRLRENNYLVAKFALTSASDYSPTITNHFQNDPSKSGISLQIFAKHRAPFKRIHWGPGLGYYRLLEKKTIFHYPTIEFQFSYRIWQIFQFSLELVAGVHGSFDTRLSDLEQKYQYIASLYGYSYGAQLFFRPYQLWGVSVAISSQRNYFANVRARQKSPEKLDTIFKEVEPFNHYLFVLAGHLRF